MHQLEHVLGIVLGTKNHNIALSAEHCPKITRLSRSLPRITTVQSCSVCCYSLTRPSAVAPTSPPRLPRGSSQKGDRAPCARRPVGARCWTSTSSGKSGLSECSVATRTGGVRGRECCPILTATSLCVPWKTLHWNQNG